MGYSVHQQVKDVTLATVGEGRLARVSINDAGRNHCVRRRVRMVSAK